MTRNRRTETGGAATGGESARGPAARDDDPFDDSEVAAILDAAWADLEP